MLFLRSLSDDGEQTYYNVVCVADFERQVVLQLGREPKHGGSTETILDGGFAIAWGGPQGTRIWNVDTRTSSFVPGREAYEAQGVPGRRALVVGDEHGGSQYDLFWVDLGAGR
jgi:hypothetical protein